MAEGIPPTPEALEEALALSDEILKDIELSRVSLSVIALKASRLARLLNDFDAQLVFQYEASGYPTTPDGIAPNIWRLLGLADRTFQQRDSNSKEMKTLAFLESIEQFEKLVETGKIGLQAAQDRNVSISSANPSQYLYPPVGNAIERQNLQNQITAASRRLASRRALIYQYASRRHYELKFSGIAQNVFTTIRESVDRYIGELIPDAVQQFAAVHDNLRSENPEDWSNAVHSCRRILQGLADAVFPPQQENRVSPRGKEIKLGPENYINRLVCFAEDNCSSTRFAELVGSHLGFLGDRLDAVFRAVQKGSHAKVSREEANRYVVYTYMLAGDILALRQSVKG
ncbi:MAG: hypothetical protein L0196_04695 [candidate division Zixibacteria bacterium]|nr:hypothetical protein [candidate division Zixibacteria bacterium]